MFDKRISHIIDNIYLGSMDGSLNTNLLKENNIQAIVRILDENMINSLKSQDDKKYLYHYIPLYDHPAENISIYIEPFLKFMKENSDKNILIHCMMGISRSAAFTILHLINSYGYELDKAVNLLKLKRPIINPNGGFLLQLKNFQDKLNLN
jgi:protein-tyrosine phosphatase